MVDTILNLHAMVESVIEANENLGAKEWAILDPYIERAARLQAIYEFKQKMQKAMPTDGKPTMASM